MAMSELVNECNQPRLIGIVETAKAIKYTIEDDYYKTDMKTEIINDLLEDRFQLLHKKEEEQQSKDILLNADQQHALEYILKVPLQNQPSNSVSAVPLEIRTDRDKDKATTSAIHVQNEFNRIAQTIQATRHANYAELEELLDDMGINVDTTDEHGNSLLILAGQQGNKKLCKFFLRRGAYINAQNHVGNTILHYLHEYEHIELANYLIRKGADDSYLNADGLTCYEVLNKINFQEKFEKN